MTDHLNPTAVATLEELLKKSDNYVQDMLDYYQVGWVERGTDDKKQFMSRLQANVVTTLAYTNEVFDFLVKINLVPKSVYIKIEHPKSQLVVIEVSLEDFLNEALLEVYSVANEIEKSSESDNYKIAFSIGYLQEGKDAEYMSSEGYLSLNIPSSIER